MTKCLLIASTFPPLIGGSCVVYHNLCRFGNGQVIPLVPYIDYHSGKKIEGVERFDHTAPYKIYRRSLVRPQQRNAASRLISLFYVMLDLPMLLGVLTSVIRLAWREGVEVVCIGELTYCGWLILPCKYLFGFKTIVYVHGEEIATSARSYAERAKFPLLRAADALIAVSDFTRKMLEERAGVNPAKIHVLLNGVDSDLFYPAPRRSNLIQRYGLGGHKVMLSVGRLVERKGVDNAIRALAAIRDRFPTVKYLIVGDGPYRATLERIAMEAGVAPNVIFVGLVDQEDLAAHYALCDIFVQPNRELEDGDTEGFGLVFLEANACGKPVVAGNAGGAVSAVSNEENGLLVDGRQVSAISAAVIRLLDDQAFYEQLRNGGLKRAAQSDWKRRAGEFIEICRSLTKA